MRNVCVCVCEQGVETVGHVWLPETTKRRLTKTSPPCWNIRRRVRYYSITFCIHLMNNINILLQY